MGFWQNRDGDGTYGTCHSLALAEGNIMDIESNYRRSLTMNMFIKNVILVVGVSS